MFRALFALALLIVVSTTVGDGMSVHGVDSVATCPPDTDDIKYWIDDTATAGCLTTDYEPRRLSDAAEFCFNIGGILFGPTAETTNLLKEYARATYLGDERLWGRYWVQRTPDLQKSWKQKVVRDNDPYCVAMDFNDPTSEPISFFGYDNVGCRDDVKLPTICSVAPTVRSSKLVRTPTEFHPQTICPPPPPPCPDCPMVSASCPPAPACVRSLNNWPDTAPPPTFLVRCPDTWFTFGKHCYHFLLAGATWKAAELSCRSDGAHLLDIEDNAENDFIARVSDELSTAAPTLRRFWIGLHDTDVEGEMVWSSGAPLGFTSWGPRQPSLGHNSRRLAEDCVVINNNFPGLWDDIPCRRTHPFICKKEAGIYNQTLQGLWRN